MVFKAPLSTRMVIWSIFIIVIALSGFLAANGFPPFSWVGIAGNEAEIDVPEILDFGNQEYGNIAIVHFALGNRGSATLAIDDIQTSCSCTGMERQEDDGKFVRINSLRIEPRQEVQLVMRLVVRGVAIGSPMHTSVSFKTNDPKKTVCQIGVVVPNVFGGVRANPKSVFCGTLMVGQPFSQIVEVWDTASSPRVIEGVVSTQPDIVTVKTLPVETPPPIGSQDPKSVLVARLEVVVNTSRASEVSANLLIGLKNDPRKSEPIGVAGSIVGPISMNPSVLILPKQSSEGLILHASCICKSRTGQPISLVAELIPRGFKVDLETHDKPDEQTIHVVFQPAEAGPLSGITQKTIRFRATIGQSETVVDLPVLVDLTRLGS